MTSAAKIASVLLLIAVLPAVFLAQTKRKAKPKTKAAATSATATPQPTPEAVPEKPSTPPKRNERPSDRAAGETKPPAFIPTHFYTFERPGFPYSPVRIIHDEAGRGEISFQKDGSDVAVSDPIELSPVTLTRLKDSFTALNFLDSTDNYQYERDYPHLGNVTIVLKNGGRQRLARFNWTENKQARVLMDEYRRISNQYIWQFEMASARENQPLEAPKLMDQMDDYLRRQEISDPQQMLPILRQFSNDERIPLIARNHAAKLAEQIAKAKK